jgi:hypothetical protein
MRKYLAIALLFSLALVACDKSDEEEKYDPAKVGIVGEWYSAGSDVAVLLSTYFSIDSIYAKFNDNNTYTVESYSQGAKTTMTGTYVQEKSNVGAIWTITLNQTTPTALTSEGIFEVTLTSGKYVMRYEVVQTSPSIGATPPTPAAGFGSSNGGALQTMNIQTYRMLVR